MNETREMLLFGDRNEKLGKALKTFEKTRKDLDEDLNIIKQWLKTQKHFPEVPKEDVLANMLISNKFSIEKLKQHLDMYYSLRSVLTDCFANKNYELPHMQVTRDLMIYVPLPKLTKEGYRITVISLTNNNAELFNLCDITACVGHFLEIRLMKDIMLGEIAILDLKNISLAHLATLTPMVLKKAITAAEKVYKNLLKQLHFINAPSYIEGTLALIKQIVSSKLSERIHVHKSFKTLANYIPSQLLPIDFGGPEHTLKELRELWYEELEDNRQILDRLDFLITDESKRPEPLTNDDILGYHGNFKRLNLD